MKEEERINKDFSWLTKNTIKLQKKYAGKWIMGVVPTGGGILDVYSTR